MSTLVTLCTFNEAGNLAELVDEILKVAPDVDILIIDDNSPDGTGEIANELAAADERVRVQHRVGKLGLGTAILSGMLFAIEHGYDWVLNLDADFSHHPRHVPAVRAVPDGADVMVGSRYVAGGGVVGWNWWRHFMSTSINIYARATLGLKSADNSGSFRCYRVAKLARIDWSRVRAHGYAFQEEVLYRCRAAGCRIQETPIVFEDRQRGRSKLNKREIVAALWIMFRLLLDRMLGVPVLLPTAAQSGLDDGGDQPAGGERASGERAGSEQVESSQCDREVDGSLMRMPDESAAP